MAVAEILSLEDVFEVLRDVDPASVDAECLASMVLGLQPLQNWVEGRAAVWLAEFAQRDQWAADGRGPWPPGSKNAPMRPLRE